MSRSLSLYLNDILKSIAKIESYVDGLSYDEFCEDERTLDAVTHNLQIIGEVTKQIPDSIRSKYSQVEWQKIAGLRDIIAHTYFKVNSKIVWSIIQTKLSSLQNCIELIMNQESLM